MKTLLLLLLPLTTSAQTCLTAIEVRKVNDLLDSYEALQEDSATFVKWQTAYSQCEYLRLQDSLQIVDANIVATKERERADGNAEKLENKSKSEGTWKTVGTVLGITSFLEAIAIGVGYATR